MDARAIYTPKNYERTLSHEIVMESVGSESSGSLYSEEAKIIKHGMSDLKMSATAESTKLRARSRNF